MTAQPVAIDLERVLGQAMQPRSCLPAQASPTAEGATSLWRVVAADGSTRVFDLGSPSGSLRDQQPLGNAEAPFRPQLPEMLATGVLGAATQPSVPKKGRRGRSAGGRGLDAAVALETSIEGVSARAGESRSVTAAPDDGLSLSPVPRQATARCRYIDPQLARIIDLWPHLPRGIQAAMLALIEAAGGPR